MSGRHRRVGVLALQGDVEPHLETLSSIGVHATQVRSREALAGLTHLVLPRGESTTLCHLLELFELWDPIVERHRLGELALMGTCAGAILLGKNTSDQPRSMQLLDADVERNAFGRQVDSFTRRVHLDALDRELDCVFIRAPRFRSVGKNARALAWDGADPILVTAPGILAASFHPELAGDPLIHEYFLGPELWTRSSTESSSVSGGAIRAPSSDA